MRKWLAVLVLCGLVISANESTGSAQEKRAPIPDKLVVLTFDDGNKSDITYAAPLLKRYGFGATFFITEGLNSRKDKKAFLTWDEVRKLNESGFEIGNHTRSHPNVARLSKEAILGEVRHMEVRFKEHGIPLPKTFCYPGWRHSPAAVEVLAKSGYLFARRGSSPEYPEEQDVGLAYDPSEDHPLLVPTTGASGPNWGWEEFLRSVKKARGGKICVLAFHGVPSSLHPWVSTKPADFARYMKYLHDEKYTVIALRDLARYVDPGKRSSDPYASIKRRLGLTATDLKCEYAVNPLGIDTLKPRFGWILESLRRGRSQSAYRVLVATSEKQLQANVGDKWDSGKINSDRSVNVEYRGKALSSDEQCWWKVRVWDKNGKASAYSEPATFEMGLLKQSDWQGEWIGAEKKISSPLLRKEFEIAKDVKQARVYISGLGWYELYVNGKRVSDHVLDPAMTNYHKHISYVTHDVTDMLTRGQNAIAVMLGNGWYSEPGRERYGNSPTLLAQMNITFIDGDTMSIKTDTSWTASAGPITRNGIQGGETYDARLEKSGWTKAGYDDSTWDHSITTNDPGGKMVSQLMPPIRVNQTFEPVKLTNPKPGVYVYDVGQVLSGWARLRVKGPRGTRVTIKYSERIQRDSGLLDKTNHPPPAETDYYILKGNPAGEVYEPRFTFHPFRYVQLENYPGTPTAKDLQAKVVHSAVDTSVEFQCSNPLVSRIHHITFWTIQNALYGMPLDAPHREPFPYLEPAETPANLYSRRYMPLLWTKWLRDVQNEQNPDGSIPVVVPNYPRHSSFDPAWSGNYPIAVWYVYQYYDDERILAAHYDSIKQWVDYVTSTADDNNLVFKGTWGDHMLAGVNPGEEEYVSSETPPPLCWTGHYYRDASIVSQAAKTLGKHDDAQHYAELAENIKDAFNKKWLNTDTNQYALGSQTGNLFALALDVVPEANRKAVAANVAKNITEKYNGHLHTGIIGTTSMMEALVENGYGDVMYNLVNRTTYPGWGYMVDQGATTIWESWGRFMKSSGRRAESMAMFATIDEFMYSDLAGIKGPDYYGRGFMTPGFKQIRIRPFVPDDLQHASASIKTVRGIISSSWKRTKNSFVLEVEIPVGSTAKVSLPTLGLKELAITEGGKAIWQNDSYVDGVAGIAVARRDADWVTFDVGSGNYRFELKKILPNTRR